MHRLVYLDTDKIKFDHDTSDITIKIRFQILNTTGSILLQVLVQSMQKIRRRTYPHTRKAIFAEGKGGRENFENKVRVQTQLELQHFSTYFLTLCDGPKERSLHPWKGEQFSFLVEDYSPKTKNVRVQLFLLIFIHFTALVFCSTFISVQKMTWVVFTALLRNL